MFDQVTMTLNVDPYIRSALQEDITSEDGYKQCDAGTTIRRSGLDL